MITASNWTGNMKNKLMKSTWMQKTGQGDKNNKQESIRNREQKSESVYR